MSSMSTMYVVFISVVVLSLIHVSVQMTPVALNDDVHKVKTSNGDFAFPDELDIGKFSRHNYRMHYHHHHDPDFHHYHSHDWDGFKEELPEVDGPRKVDSNTSMQIPLEFIQNINNYNVSDLLLNFVEDDETEGPLIQDRFGETEGQERNAATMPKEAGCIPELRAVKIATSDDPSILYIPRCTRIERCGGCCSHALLACQPQETEYVNYKVIKTQYTGGKKLKLVGKEVVLVEKHTKCKCDCRVRPEDCNKFQEYKKSECRCACTNYDEEKKCYKNNATKLWNPDLCACQCRETMQCSTGSYFDQGECRCTTIPMKRRFVNYERRNYKSVPSPVVPLDED